MEMTIEYPLKSKTDSKPYLAGPAIKTESPSLTVEVHSSEDVFEELLGEWNNLLIKADAPFCMSLEWVKNWWHYFGRNPNRQLYVIVIRNGKDLVALAPFYVGYTKIGNKVVSKRLQLIGSGGSKNEQWGFLNDYGISDFLDIIVDPGFQEPISKILFELISVLLQEVDQLNFTQVRDDSFIKQVLLPKMETMNWNITTVHTDTCPYVDLKEVSELTSFIKGIDSSNARRRLRQTVRAMEEEPEFIVTEVSTPEGLKKATDRLIELHQSRWNELGFPGVFHDERFERFFKDLINICAEKGWLWFKEAQDVEGVAASRMLIKFNGRYYDYISGFDPQSPSAKYRPGFGLMLDVIKDAFSQKIHSLELLRGEEGYKYDFTDRNFKNWQITISKEMSGIQKINQKMLRLISLIYITAKKERELLSVQYQNSGLFRALPGYVSFRTESLRRKLKGT